MNEDDTRVAKAYHEAVKLARNEVLRLTDGTRHVRVGVFSADLNNRLVDLEVRTLGAANVGLKNDPRNELFTFDDGTDVNGPRRVDTRRRLEEVTKDEYDAYLLVDWRGGASEPALEVKVGRLGDRSFSGVLSPPAREMLDRPLITLTMIVPQKVATPVVHLDMTFELSEADRADPFGKTPLVDETNLRILRDRGEDI